MWLSVPAKKFLNNKSQFYHFFLSLSSNKKKVKQSSLLQQQKIVECEYGAWLNIIRSRRAQAGAYCTGCVFSQGVYHTRPTCLMIALHSV